MPNWCNNVLKISHTDPLMIKRMVDSAQKGILAEFVPCPQDLIDTVSGRVGTNDDPKQIELEAKQEANIVKYGFANWYDWQVANWGTKWDFCEVDVDQHDASHLTITFDTAWAPPVNAYDSLAEQGFDIEAYYYEPGMQFAGTWIDGFDEYYEDWGNAEECRNTLPKVLDEMFAISENQEVWEEDEEA